MTMVRRIVPAEIRSLGDDEVEVILSTAKLVRQDGLALVPGGCVIDDYRRNPIWLWSHDPDLPIGNADPETIVVGPGDISCRVRFAPSGVSAKADEIRGLVKAGVVRAVSIGFDPIEWEPLDPRRPGAGKRVTRWVLFECSFVSVGADADALVTARAQEGDDMADWKVGAARDLPIDNSDAWDGAAAEESIFEHAGGDDFKPSEARRGFLFYDASKPKERGSYRDPIAHVVNGELKVPKGAIRAAASRLPQTDVPQEAKDEADKVLAHYKEKADIGDDSRGRAAPQTRDGRSVKFRGLYHVANLCWLLDLLCDLHSSAAIEAALEGDGSAVPGKLHEALVALGEILVAMTEEEVAELVAANDDFDPGPVDFAGEPAIQRFRRGLMLARAGKALSKANAARIDQAQDNHDRALEHHAAAEEQCRALGDCQASTFDANETVRAQHEKIGDALDRCRAAMQSSDTDEAAAAVDRCLRAHTAMGRNLDAITAKQEEMADAQEAVSDAHRGIARTVRAARRALAGLTGEDDATAVQTSDGTGDSAGSSNDRGHRRRRRLRAQQLAAGVADIAA